MTLLLLLCGAIAVALPGMRPRPLMEANPRSFTRLAVVSVIVGVTSVVGGLALSASVGAMHVVLDRPSTSVDHLAPEGDLGALGAAALLTIVLVRSAILAVRSMRLRRTSRADSWLGEHARLDGVDLVVLPTDAPVAYNVPGRSPQIVISHGLRQQLDPDLLRFVLDHERAHLRSKHGGVALLAVALDTVFRFVPGSTRTALAMRIGVECSADEDAAAGIGPLRRHRLALGMEDQGARLRTSCGELVNFRSRTLAIRSQASLWLVGRAAVGVAAVAIAGLSTALHATVDFGPYLAML